MQVIKGVAFTAVYFTIAFGASILDLLTKEDYQCMEDLNIDVNQLLAHFDDDFKLKPDDQVLLAEGVCWLKRMKMMDDNNNLNWDNLVQLPIMIMPLYGKQDMANKEEVAANVLQKCREDVLASQNIATTLNNCIGDQLSKL
ncbi:uncharacterized protein LOC116170129 [Photinus pyralis]|uniref:Uncharacterized protein n=1 Tax=Photinus pyralis TaxID=7054 RepID=A0A1Y1NHM6_PHOPY|nr:uncharacterized protein LOC116170129 [Photinus pyralis]